eukprot:1237183-Prymnesium_polylepis.1
MLWPNCHTFGQTATLLAKLPKCHALAKQNHARRRRLARFVSANVPHDIVCVRLSSSPESLRRLLRTGSDCSSRSDGGAGGIMRASIWVAVGRRKDMDDIEKLREG